MWGKPVLGISSLLCESIYTLAMPRLQHGVDWPSPDLALGTAGSYRYL